MSPTPISPSTVQVTLQYISPPSQLDQPLPPYLLSKSLLQRHHFLSIAPDDPQEYLCWPTSREQAPKAIELLDAIPVPASDDAPRNFPVHYSFDGEYIYAHADVSHDNAPGARLVFQWDEDDGWKYHDAGVMPFPPNSQASLLDVLENKPSVFQPTAPNPLAVDSFNSYGFDTENSSDDDDYWNAYGSQDALDESEKDPISLHSDVVGTEDAYWAQYASVHGTADSTRPSPLPVHRRKPQQFELTDPDSPNPLPVRIGTDDPAENASPLPVAATRILTADSRWGPASPRTLSHLLSFISPRESAPQSPIVTSEYESQSDFLSPPERSSGSEESHTPSPPGLGYMDDDDASRISGSLSNPDEVQTPSTELENDERDNIAGPDLALRQSLKGLYELYKLQYGKAADEDAIRQSFLRIAEEASS